MKKITFRVASLLLSLILLFTLAPTALAAEDWQELVLIVSWTDDAGEQAVQALPMGDTAEEAFWAVLPQSAFDAELSVTGFHPNHEYELEVTGDNTINAGSTVDPNLALVIYLWDGEAVADTCLLYLSTEPMPEVTAREPAQANANVVCRTTDGTVLQSWSVTVVEGQPETIDAPQFDGYVLQSAASVDVWVYEDGSLSADPV